MKEISVIDKFQTGWGLILGVEADQSIKPGDIVYANGVVYEVRRIMLSTRPQFVARVGLVVKEKDNNSKENFE